MMKYNLNSLLYIGDISGKAANVSPTLAEILLGLLIYFFYCFLIFIFFPFFLSIHYLL